MKRLLLIVLGWLVLSLAVHAASFDCAKEKSEVEKLVCVPNSLLSKMDDDLDTAYQWALVRMPDKQKVRNAQRHWLKTVRNVCRDEACLWRVYQSRLDELAIAQAKADAGKCYALSPLKDAHGKVRQIEPVCQVLEKNLNRFCEQPPMACGLKIAAEFRDQLTLPTWMQLDLEANRTLIEEFIRAPWQDGSNDGSDERRWQEAYDKIEKAFAKKRITFSQAQLDLYNLGNKQTAYRLDYGDCEANNPQFKDRQKWGWEIHSASVQIQPAPEITRALFQQYFPIGRSPLSEVFLYGGKAYSFWMQGKSNMSGVGGSPAQNILIIDRHERWIEPISKEVNLHKDNICFFSYQPI